MYQSVCALRYQPVLYMYYESELVDLDRAEGVLIDHVVDLQGYRPGEDLLLHLNLVGGIGVTRGHVVMIDHFPCEKPEQVEWVTPRTTFNRQEGAFISYGNEATLDWIYGDVCLVVRIGKAGDRLAYPIVAELDSW